MNFMVFALVRYRELAKVRKQCHLTAVAQNVKMLRLLLSKRGKDLVLVFTAY
jgi:hypothetical protein